MSGGNGTLKTAGDARRLYSCRCQWPVNDFQVDRGRQMFSSSALRIFNSNMDVDFIWYPKCSSALLN